MTIVKPPIGDPDTIKDEYWLLKKTLYGLRRSPRHWYNKITAVLSSIGLKPNASDPCMFTGIHFATQTTQPWTYPQTHSRSAGEP